MNSLASLLVRRPAVPEIIVIAPVRMNVPDPSAGAPMTRSILESPLKSPVVKTDPIGQRLHYYHECRSYLDVFVWTFEMKYHL